MSRRSAGLAVMLVTLIAVVVIGARLAATRGIAGAARSGPVPAPPDIGDCLLDPPGDFGGWGFGGPLYPALRLAPCTGLRWGEVVSVRDRGLVAATIVTTTDESGATVTAIPNQSSCDHDRSTYVGAHPDIEQGWNVAIGMVAAVGPTALQRSGGQSWVACVITPTVDQGITPVPYRGSVRNALTVGTLPAAYAVCSTEARAGALPVPCDQAHHVEILGVLSTSPQDTQATLTTGCGAMAGWLMRTPDPTRSGLLAVRAVPSHTELGTDAGGLDTIGNPLEAVCVVEPIASRNLDGTVVGLGSQPIPWA